MARRMNIDSMIGRFYFEIDVQAGQVPGDGFLRMTSLCT
jgi:hypothetical protein